MRALFILNFFYKGQREQLVLQHFIIFMLLLFLQYMRKKLSYIFETFFRFHLEK